MARGGGCPAAQLSGRESFRELWPAKWRLAMQQPDRLLKAADYRHQATLRSSRGDV